MNKHFISHRYAREIRHASMLLAVQHRIAQADLILDQMENCGCTSLTKLRERCRQFEGEADRLFQRLAGENALLDDAVMEMAKKFTAADKRQTAQKKRNR